VKDLQRYISASKGFVTITQQEYEELCEHRERYNALQIDHEYLKQEISQLKRLIYGTKSERFAPAVSPDQLTLFEAKDQPAPEPQTETITYTRNKKDKKQAIGHGRPPIPAHLPRVVHVIEPEDKPEGARWMGEVVTEVLEYMPGKLYVDKYIRPKYALPQGEGIVIGVLPSLPVPRGNVGAGLLAHIMVSKYVDHLPFYRQAQQFRRQGMEVAESTLNGWFSAGCKLLETLYGVSRKKIQQATYLMADETPIPVTTKDKPGATHKGYLWTYYDPLERMVLFDYRKTRSRDGPREFLENFQGALQTDGYEAYTIFEKKEGIALLACMAHARRKFDEAKGNDKARAEHMLGLMQRLYATEKTARDKELSYKKRKQLRQVESLPVLKEMEAWMKEHIVQVLPKSAIGKALAYTLKLWPRLLRYVEDGRYEIDNNLIENTIRPVALGRKNYLFAGSHEGAKRAAIIYSLISTCKQRGVEPFAWLKKVLTALPDCKQSQLEGLLP